MKDPVEAPAFPPNPEVKRIAKEFLERTYPEHYRAGSFPLEVFVKELAEADEAYQRYYHLFNECQRRLNSRTSATAEAEKELERERMRLAGCGVAAMCNTPETAARQRIDQDNPYWSASYGDVCRAVDREMALRAERDAALAEVKRLREALKFYAEADVNRFFVIDTGKPHPNHDGNLYEIIEANEDVQTFGTVAKEALAADTGKGETNG